MPSDSTQDYRLSRRQALRLSAGFAGGAALAGCGLHPAWAAPPAQDAQTITVPGFVSGIEAKPVKLELWTFHPTLNRWYTLMADAYKAQVNPDFELSVVETAYEDHHTKLLVSFESGGVGAPDICDLEQGRFGAFIKGDVGVADLSERLASGGYLDQIVVARQALYSVGEAVYGLEHALTPVVLYYRSDLYEAAGVTIPMATWEDFIAATKSLVNDNVKGLLLDWERYDIALRQAGFDTFDVNGNVTADSADAISTFEWFLGLRDNHGVAAEPPAGAQATGNTADQSFWAALNEGQYIALPGADWFGGFLKDNAPDLAGKWKAQYLPAFTAGGARTSVNGGTGAGIVKTSDKQDVAWDFFRYSMLTTEGVVQKYLLINLWPAFKPAWEDERMFSADTYFSGQELGRLYAEVGAEAPAQYQSAYRADFNILRRDKYTRDLFDGKLSPADGLKQLSDEIRAMQGS